MTDNLIEFVMWPIIIGANVLAYYYDLYYNDKHHQLEEGDEDHL